MWRRAETTAAAPSLPIVRLLVLVLGLWGSLWGAGHLGARIGEHVYTTRTAPPAPYTPAQLRSMELASSEAASVARQDLRVWSQTVAMGASMAQVEGALAGSLAMLALWGTLGAVWLFRRERNRGARERIGGYAQT